MKQEQITIFVNGTSLNIDYTLLKKQKLNLVVLCNELKNENFYHHSLL